MCVRPVTPTFARLTLPLALFAASLACNAKREHPSPARATSVASAGASASARAPSPRDASAAAFCERMRAEHRRQKPEFRRVESDASANPVLSHELERGGCFAGKWGAWAVELKSLAEYPEWQPVFREPDGRIVEPDRRFLDDGARGPKTRPPSHLLALRCCGPTGLPRGFEVADFDGDARPELAFGFVWEGAEGGEGSEYAVLTARGGEIRWFDPGFAFHGVEDVDKDGRLDLVVSPTETVRLSCEDYGYAKVTGARLILHGVSAGFSSTDAVAQEHARKECPKRPERIVSKNAAGVVDHSKTAKNAMCARAWGASPIAIDAALARDCEDPSLHETCRAAERAPNECWARSLWQDWLKGTPVVFEQ
jgi:hypothetical protein